MDEVHLRGNLILHKWASNDPAAVAGLATEPAASDVCVSNEEKVPGPVWRPADNTLMFNFRKVDTLHLNKQITKRESLKTAISLYDPLGLVTPVTSQAKRILQETWRHNVGWDEYLPDSLEKKWGAWLRGLESLKHVRIPRCSEGVEPHVFVDASELCPAAAAKWRSVDEKGNVRVSLAAAKGRVAPLKVTSVPRLELQAAAHGGRLAATVEAELEKTTAQEDWRWVPTAHGVTDDVTRDVAPDFGTDHCWFRSPSFLYDDEETWPREREPLAPLHTGDELVTVPAATATTTPRLIGALPDATRFSRLRLLRTTARVLQLIERCRARVTAAVRKRTKSAVTDDAASVATRPNAARARPGPPTRTRLDAPPARIPLAAQYRRRAELLRTRATRQECFADELRDVTGGRAGPASSRLRKLSLITDQGVLRMRSRMAAAADVAEEALAPAVLDGDHYYCRLYTDWIHRKLHHKCCQPCRRRLAAPPEPLTCDLPLCRLAHQHAFTNTGLYFGPVSVTAARHQEKRYVALFTCLPTRAVHSENAASLSTDAAVQALRRMLARRGWVREVLPELQNQREPRGRGEAIREGDVVATVYSNLPRNVWPKGRAERVYPGADGVVRVVELVDVVTKSGIMRRPAKILIKLPID